MGEAYHFFNNHVVPDAAKDFKLSVVRLIKGMHTVAEEKPTNFPASFAVDAIEGRAGQADLMTGFLPSETSPHFVQLVSVPASTPLQTVQTAGDSGFYIGVVLIHGTRWKVVDNGMWPWGHNHSSDPLHVRMSNWCQDIGVVRSNQVMNCCSFASILAGLLSLNMIPEPQLVHVARLQHLSTSLLQDPSPSLALRSLLEASSVRQTPSPGGGGTRDRQGQEQNASLGASPQKKRRFDRNRSLETKQWNRAGTYPATYPAIQCKRNRQADGQNASLCAPQRKKLRID